MEIQGLHNTAKVFTDNIDEITIAQVTELCNQPFTAGEDIRIMPDCHAGAGCVIGTTMTLRNGKVVPNLVGVDIGCGMHVCELYADNIDLKKLDYIIHNEIPSGFNVRSTRHDFVEQFEKQNGKLIANVGSMERHLLSIGTLGGGNHFIEIDRSSSGLTYLVIHTGSRNLGKQVAEYWQRKAIETCEEKVPDALAYLSGKEYEMYLHDMEIAQSFANFNRIAIGDIITTAMGWGYYSETDRAYGNEFETVHNYISLKDGMLRKGAISAKPGEKVIIPLNMRDGSIIAVGKGNPGWNCSAPHGAGRILSRSQAKKQVDVSDFVDTMKGVYSTTVNKSTLDESPMAYKNAEEIIANIGDTVSILDIIKPIYNFKDDSSSKRR